MPQAIPLPIILFLICVIIIPLHILVIELIRWPRLHKWEKALVIFLAVFVLAASFFAPGLLGQ